MGGHDRRANDDAALFGGDYIVFVLRDGVPTPVPVKTGLTDLSLSEGKVSGGTGFRYLISRVFGIRTGMDFAWSEGDFSFYFTTGTAWGQK